MERYNLDKFINATLFFVKEKVKKLGITKLNKLLYYSDFEHYRLHGRSIIGDSYIRMPQGPVPEKSYNIFKENFDCNENDSLKEAICLRHKAFPKGSMKIIAAMPTRKPDLSFFSKSELTVMRRIAYIWKDATAMMASDQSHLEKPYQMVSKNGDAIDYKSVLLEEKPDSIPIEYAEYQEKENLLLRKSFI